MSAFTGAARDTVPAPEAGADLLAALLDGMDAALCALDADGTITHWNREAERILGWPAAEAVGRRGFDGWAARSADAARTLARVMGAMRTPGRQVHELALLRKDGGRVLVRCQTAGVRAADGRPAGVYCAFSEVHVQIDLERSIALSEALFDDAPWGVVLVDADLRPAVVNDHAARAIGAGRTALLGRPLGEVVAGGVEELEGALQHVLAEGAPPAPADLWVTLAARPGAGGGERRRCWRSGFVRLSSPMTEEPVPLGVAWLFQDVTEERRAAREADRTRFRWAQLHRAGVAAAEYADPAEAVAVLLDFALAGFADHGLVDRVAGGRRLTRAVASPGGAPEGAGFDEAAGLTGGFPQRYGSDHPAFQAWDRAGSVRTEAGRDAARWAEERHWPAGTAHALCTALRSRGRTVGVLTFLRTAARGAFERADVVYAETVAARVAGCLDLPGELPGA
ncbi:PAS domain-containing protein [Streptomyces termitum]|uniref:PAS domain-containing protein n=1 Tax=Streptomyces termitum TaxID=67368 RepID=UPI0016743B75|nr:PAS domain-containing protein [Streptomyces termitum]